MINDVTALDAYIDSPEQREIVQVLRFLLFATEFKDHVLVYGDPSGGEDFLLHLMRTYPVPQDNVLMLAVRERKVIGSAGYERDVPAEVTVSEMLRSFFRQDPDVMVVSEVADQVTAEIVITAAQTGHRIIMSSPSPSLQAWRSNLAVLAPEMHEFLQCGLAVELARISEKVVRIKRVLLRAQKGEELEEVAVVGEDGGAVLKRELLPAVPVPTAPLYVPKFRDPVAAWPKAHLDPRPAYIPVVTADGEGVSRVGGKRALRPAGEAWPMCVSCGKPLALLVQLDLAHLPQTFPGENGMAQLFVCTREGGCDTFSETDPGVQAEVLRDVVLHEVRAPETFNDPAIVSGAIVEWKEYLEDPGYGDGPVVSEDDPQYFEDNPAEAQHCDKLGGWPAWQQHNDWPLNADGTRMQLLYQIAEGDLREGGTTSGWDYEKATFIPASGGSSIIDPNYPHHFRSLWSGDAVAMLFIDNTGTKLALRVQMG